MAEILGFPHGFNGNGNTGTAGSSSCYPPIEIAEPINEIDPVNSPPHYKQNGVEAIDVIEHIAPAYPSVMTYHIGNVLKYLCRAPHKGNLLEDLKKARWYLDRVIGDGQR